MNSPLCCAWDNTWDTPGLDGGHSITALCTPLLDRLELQWELESIELWPVDVPMQEWDILQHL